MPEHLRALIVVLAIASIVFVLSKRPACQHSIYEKDFIRRRNTWFCITLAAFLSHHFFLFIFFTLTIVIISCQHEKNKFALYYFVLFTIPVIPDQIVIFNVYLFEIHYARLLSLTILLYALADNNRALPARPKFGFHIQDIILLVYLLLRLIIHRGIDNPIEILRYYFIYPLLDIYLPYYVFSRAFHNIQEFRDLLMSFVIPSLILAIIAVQECTRHWLLYAALPMALGVPWDYGKYLGRGSLLRALATPGQAIALGYVMSVAIGIYLYFRTLTSSPMIWRLGLATLFGGLVAALSRGPWFGTLVMIYIFAITGPRATTNLLKLCGLILVMVAILSLTPAWDNIIDYLPFVGNIDSENVDFRSNLLDGCIKIIMENPIFGPPDPMQELEQFRTGEGIIDIVNSYLVIGLYSGLTGIGLFVMFFMSICLGVYHSMARLQYKDSELYLLGRTLLCTLIGIQIIIFTVSSVTVIPYVYWTLGGVSVAYIRFVAQQTSS